MGKHLQIDKAMRQLFMKADTSTKQKILALLNDLDSRRKQVGRSQETSVSPPA